MPTPLLRFAIALVAFVVLDGLFIAVAGHRLYQDKLFDLLRPQALLVWALPFYPLFALAIAELAVRSDASWMANGARGALLGLCAYATYGLTNVALIAGWSRVVTVVDIGWGAVVGAATATITTVVLSKLGRG
jgi:uncharacterized membrane protein